MLSTGYGETRGNDCEKMMQNNRLNDTGSEDWLSLCSTESEMI